jgi:hypothetical protein
MTAPYATRHVGLAAFLRYVLGDESHLSTTKGGTGYIFSFDDPSYRCNELQTAFFSDDGAIAGNALTLLECSRAISQTIMEAKLSGAWERSL